MSEQITHAVGPEASAALADVLARQLLALDGVFRRAFADTVRRDFRSNRDMRRALRAQAQCRHTLRILRSLRDAEPAKIVEFERTNY